jgi:hypothetical protein
MRFCNVAVFVVPERQESKVVGSPSGDPGVVVRVELDVLKVVSPLLPLPPGV